MREPEISRSRLNGFPEGFDEEADLLPEYCHYQDEGCEFAIACLSCPFARYVYEEPGGKQRFIKGLRDNEILRLYTDGRKLYRQRVANPGPGSDFSQWTYSSQYNVIIVAAAALGAEVSVFFIWSDRAVYQLKSTDYGTKWGESGTHRLYPHYCHLRGRGGL